MVSRSSLCADLELIEEAHVMAQFRMPREHNAILFDGAFFLPFLSSLPVATFSFREHSNPRLSSSTCRATIAFDGDVDEMFQLWYSQGVMK